MNRNSSNNLYANVSNKNNITNESGTLKWNKNPSYNVYTNVFGENNNKKHESSTIQCLQKYQINCMLTKVSKTNRTILESNSLNVKRKPSNSLYTNVPGVSNDIIESNALTSYHQHTNSETFKNSDENSRRSEYNNITINNNRNPINHLNNKALLNNFENLDSMSSRNRKPIGHLYADVFVENIENLNTQNEPTDCYKADYNLAKQSSKAIDGTHQTTIENVQYPFYDNTESFVLGKDIFSFPQSPENSRYSKYKKYLNFKFDPEYFDKISFQVSNMNKSVLKPANVVHSSSEMMSLSPQNSFSKPIITNKHDTDVSTLSESVMYSMLFNNRKIKGNPNPFFLNCIKCTKCNKKILDESLGCIAMKKIYHIKCFACTSCGMELNGSSFHHINKKPYCVKDYYVSLEKCVVCKLPIFDTIIRGSGCSYHFQCFHCVVCLKLLKGIYFTVDSNNQIYCINDYYNKFAPKCDVCKLPIKPEDGQEETLRFVALDRSFHVQCFRCEDCGTFVGSKEVDKGCYPLDDHVLCKSCNANRIRDLTSALFTDV